MVETPDERAERLAHERQDIAGVMYARLHAASASDVYPEVHGVRPVDGPDLIQLGRWRATWALVQGGTLLVEARWAGDDWQVIVLRHDRAGAPESG